MMVDPIGNNSFIVIRKEMNIEYSGTSSEDKTESQL